MGIYIDQDYLVAFSTLLCMVMVSGVSIFFWAIFEGKFEDKASKLYNITEAKDESDQEG